MDNAKFSLSEKELKDMATKHIAKSKHLRKFKNSDEELVNDVCYAIWLAHNKFDAKKGKSLKTYIIDHCNWTILNYINAQQKTKKSYSNVDNLYQTYEHKDFHNFENKDLISFLLKKTILTTKEKEVIQMKYFDNMSSKEIKETMKVSKQYVNKIHKDAIRELRATAERFGLS